MSQRQGRKAAQEKKLGRLTFSLRIGKVNVEIVLPPHSRSDTPELLVHDFFVDVEGFSDEEIEEVRAATRRTAEEAGGFTFEED